MKQSKTNFIVGLFILIGMAIIAATVIYVGATGYFQKGSLYAAYFDESVQGLNKDSQVKYRGVPVGQVHDIKISGESGLVEVIMRIEPGWEPSDDIVAQLKSIGITGIMFVELDKKKPGDMLGGTAMPVRSQYPVIPTRTSNIQELMTELADITRQLKGLDLPGISASLKKTLENASTAIADADAAVKSLKTAVPGMKRFTEQAGKASAHLDELIAENREPLGDAIKSVKVAMDQTRSTMEGGAATLNRIELAISGMEEKINSAIAQINEATRELKELGAKGATQPSQLLFASPPPEKPMDKD